MGEIINTNTAIETQPGGDTGALLDITQSLLADARTALNSSGVLSVPIAELSTLGAGVSSLIPALNTVTQTTSMVTSSVRIFRAVYRMTVISLPGQRRQNVRCSSLISYSG